VARPAPRPQSAGSPRRTEPAEPEADPARRCHRLSPAPARLGAGGRGRPGPAGAELEPVTDGLGQWGLQHAWRWPQPGEPLHAEHLLRSVVQAIELAADDHQPVRWHFRLDGGDYLVESDGRRWSLTAPSPAPQNPAAPSPAPPSQAGPADVTITAPTRALTAFIFAGSDRDVDIAGATGPVQRFRRLITAIATVVADQPENTGQPGNIGQPGNTGQPENGSRALRA
jgi:hypothetical protein